MTRNLISPGRTTDTSRMPGWEQEFWHYVSTGDGVTCPVYEKCKLHTKGYEFACPLKVVEPGHSDSINICQPETNYTFKPGATLRCHTNVGFIEGLRPGRIFELLDLLSRSWLRKA